MYKVVVRVVVVIVVIVVVIVVAVIIKTSKVKGGINVLVFVSYSKKNLD